MKVSASIPLAKLHIVALRKGKVSNRDLNKGLKSLSNAQLTFKHNAHSRDTIDALRTILSNQNSQQMHKKSSIINQLAFLTTPKPRKHLLERLIGCKNDMANLREKKRVNQSPLSNVDYNTLSRLHFLHCRGQEESFA